MCDHNYTFAWENSSTCPGSLFIYCKPCPSNSTSKYPDYAGPYGTTVKPGYNAWLGSPLNCTLAVASPGYYKNASQTCDPLNYCILPCDPSYYCPGGNSVPVPCPGITNVTKTSNFFGTAADCV
jgi:hypothetical protein